MELWYLSWSSGESFLVEFLHADLHVMRQHEIEKRLLLAVEAAC